MSLVYIQIRKKVFGQNGAFEKPISIESFIKRYPTRNDRIQLLQDESRTKCIDTNFQIIPNTQAVTIFMLQEDDIIFGQCKKASHFQKYLQDFPEGKNYQAAQEKILDLSFDSFKSISDYEMYLYHLPQGKNAQKALKKLDELYYKKASKSGNEGDYAAYLEKFPNGAYYKKARFKVQSHSQNINYLESKKQELSQKRFAQAPNTKIKQLEEKTQQYYSLLNKWRSRQGATKDPQEAKKCKVQIEAIEVLINNFEKELRSLK